jgi:predicted exporter
LETLASVYTSQAAHLYSYRPETDLQRLFSAEGLAQRAKLLKQGLLSPYSASIKKIAATDPLLLSLNGIGEKSPLFFKSATSAANYQHLIIETTPSGMDVAAQTYIQQQMLTVFAAQKHRFAEAVDLEITGVPVFASVTQNRMQHEMQRISVISALVLCGLFFWLFKSLRLLFWVMALLVSVVCSALLVTQFVFGFVHALTLAIGTTLIGICVDYPIHALVHGQSVHQTSPTQAVAQIFPSMLLGGATTLIGYFALGLSGYPGFEQVAVYAGVGIAVALLLTRWVLPPFIHANLPTPVTIRPALRWLNIAQQYRGYLLTGIAAALVVSVLALPSLHWMQDLQQLTPEMDELKAKDAQIRSRLVSVEPGRFVLISADNTEQALQRLEQIYPQLDKLKAQGDLKDYFGLYPWLLSQQQQHDNARQLQQVLNPVNREHWQQSLLSEGLSVAYLGKLNYPSKQTLNIEQVFATPLGHVLEQQLIHSDKHTLTMIWLAEHNALALQKTFTNHPFAHYISQRDMLNDMAISYQSKAVSLLLLGLLFIVALLTWRYKNLWHALETLAPAVLAAIFVLAGCALAGVAISFLHLVGLLLIVSIGVDYGIFYRENRSHNLPLTYQAMATSMLTSSLAFACLLLAETTVLKILAQVVATGVVLGFLLCPLLIQKTPASTS